MNLLDIVCITEKDEEQHEESLSSRSQCSAAITPGG